MPIGKTAQNAISTVSYLAECYRDDTGPVNSQTIADARNLSKPLVAKILTTLSQTGCVKGSSGPGGGYKLAKPPSEIQLLDIVSPFELQNKFLTCPFGEEWCETYANCPLHTEIKTLQKQFEKFLTNNTLGGFSKPKCCPQKTEKTSE